MGNLGDDTTVRATGDGCYRAALSREWAMWGPNGGYLASIALRAAGAANPLAHPGGLSCQFVNVAEFDEVELEVTRQRRSRRVELHRVRMLQGDSVILDAHVWTVTPEADGPRKQWSQRPEAPEPTDLPSMDEIVAAEGGTPLPLWRNYEVRPAQPLDRGTDRVAGEPRLRAWIRFREQATFPNDPWLDACRHVVATDIVAFPSASQGFSAEECTFIAPSLDLHVAFHDTAPAQEWLLIEGQGLAAGTGLCGARGHVWSPHGPLLSSGSQQMLLTTPRRN